MARDNRASWMSGSVSHIMVICGRALSVLKQAASDRRRQLIQTEGLLQKTLTALIQDRLDVFVHAVAATQQHF